MSNSNSGRLRVLIADDHELARAGMKAILANAPSIEVVGEAENGVEAVELCRLYRPDIILMDVRMPEMDGLAATAAIKAEVPSVSVIIVTMHENPDYLSEAMRAGAAGYLLKDATQRDVLTAIRRVADGGSMLNSRLASDLLRRLLQKESRPGAGTIEPLTPRENEVLQLLARGFTNREIASSLIISVGTAKLHVERIIGKMGVADRTQAAVLGTRLGLVTQTL